MTKQLLINKASEQILPPQYSNDLSVSLKKILCQFARYYNGKTYRFNLDENQNLILQQVEHTENKASILIVARAFYSEQAKDYPIDNKAELKKLLALEFAVNDNYHTHIWGSENGHSQVNIWQFNQSVPSAYILLPETLLLGLSANEQQIITLNSDNSEERKLFIGRLGKVIHSLRSTSIINSTQRFSMSVGIAPSEQNVIIDQNSFAKQISYGVKKLTLPIISTFIQRSQKVDRMQLLKNICLPFFMVLSVYLILTSGYLSLKKYNLQQQLASHSSEVSSALNLQQSLDDKQTRYLALQHFFSNQQTSSPVWLPMAELFPQAQFTNIRLDNNRFILRGTTQQATQLLEQISKHPRIADAKFDFPTRKNRNQDAFVISFVLVPIPESESETEPEPEPIVSHSEYSEYSEVNHG